LSGRGLKKKNLTKKPTNIIKTKDKNKDKATEKFLVKTKIKTRITLKTKVPKPETA